jgi:hypothetical protein
MIAPLAPLKSINPSLQHIKLNKKRAESFPDLLKVMECHTRSTDYMIQFFSEPLIENCACKGFSNGLFKPVRMPRQVYEEVIKYPMPMPILKPIAIGENISYLQYLSFAEARQHPFTNKFKPSLETNNLRIAAKKKKKAATQKLASSRCALAPNIERLKKKTCFKIGMASRVRGVVGRNDYINPRCIYSFSAIFNMKVPLPSRL